MVSKLFVGETLLCFVLCNEKIICPAGQGTNCTPKLRGCASVGFIIFYSVIIQIRVVSFIPKLAPSEPRFSIRPTVSLPVKLSKGEYS